jgi:hypothetical protein
MTTEVTRNFLKTPRCHTTMNLIVDAATRAADEAAREHGLSERQREIVLRLAAGALLWLPKL